MSKGATATCMLAMGSVVSLVAAISLFAGIMTLSLVLCLLFLRWKQPKMHRPLKIPIAIPIVVTALMVIILSVSIYKEPAALIFNLVIISLGLPIYILVFKCEAVKKRLTFMDRVGFYLEKLFSLQYET
ncbi:hypothetical protein RRG08_034471 [Elysia crispata]|uniref:Uncharacterized protein n=1 Tax=Elysia crispata TaxID=231223 RepID=A0AAE0XTJ2_9GAST|nr:hypothetical protein RRG08_034471 [Elysia crispata]